MGPVPLVAGGNRVTIGVPAVIQIPTRVFRVRLTGMLFDTDKCFLLSSALESIRALRKIWDKHPEEKVLVVGHADHAGAAEHNRQLSVERARAIVSYLRDEVDAWLRFYSPGVPPTKNWGAKEDQEMLAALQFGSVADFQSARGLEADGVAGSQTRRALVTEYMAQDGTRLDETHVAEIHGCGETHPEIPTADGVAHEKNRRVEIYLFEDVIDPAPVDPCPPGGCSQQPVWANASKENTVDLGLPLGQVVVTVTDDSGAPIAAADIHLAGFVPDDATTGADGVATLVDIIPLDYEVFARKAGFASASQKIDVPPATTVPVALVLKAAAGALDVLARDTAGAPLAAATVDILGPQATAATGVTDANGRALFASLPAGSYQITVKAIDFVDGAATDTVSPDTTTTTVVTLTALGPGLSNGRVDPGPPPPATQDVALRLLDLRGRPLANRDATVSAGTTRAFATSDAAGELHLQFPPGTTRVVVTYAPPDAEGLVVDWPVRLDLPAVDTDEGAHGRLTNLGYPAGTDLEFAVFSFQVDHEVATVTGVLDDPTRKRLVEVHGS